MSLGAYDDEEAAARAYDLAALKYWGPGTLINFPVRNCLMKFHLGQALDIILSVTLSHITVSFY